MNFSVGEYVWYVSVDLDSGKFLPAKKYKIVRIKPTSYMTWIYCENKYCPINAQQCSYSKKEAIRLAKELFS